MILRTPPRSKRSRGPHAQLHETPRVGLDNQLFTYEDPIQMPAESMQEPDVHSEHMLCTYQCRQMVKTDFIDALRKAESQVEDYQSKFEQLNENLRKAESERERFLDQFLYAEQELAAANGREKALQNQIREEVADCKERLKKQIEVNSDLELKLQNERQLRSKAESNAASAEEKANSLEVKLNHLFESIDKEKKRVLDECTLLKRESKLSLTRLTADLERMEFRAKSAEEEVELLKEQVEHLGKQFSECLREKSELDRKLSNFGFQEVDSSDSSILVKHLKEELQNSESELREARRLKASHQNVELLNEKLREEKNGREKAELELSQLQEIQQNMNKLEEQLSLWTLIMKDIPGISCFEEIPVKLAALQEEVLGATRKEGDLNCSIKQLEVDLDEARINQKNAETEVALAKERAEILTSELTRIATLLDVATKEKDELTSHINELKKSKNDKAGDVPSGTHIEDLKSQLSKGECRVKELESNLVEQKESNNRQHEEIKSLNERLHHEAKRVKSLERENDRLRSEIALLEAKLGHGDYSTTNTKVLRMVNTFAVDDEAKSTIEALQSELKKTKEKLQAVEELERQSGDSGKLLDSYISGKISQLKEQIATLEKREERYKTVFADRISVFRRACCELFGYKIVMDEHQRPNGIPVTHFTLQSIYAQTDDEKLEFEYESGTTKIMVNDYASQPEISRQVDIFIRKMHSIPAFTANLTVESFNRRTLS